ncbi:MFS transporter [Streptomyces sp. MB09-01]|uniref:MFS transporter n=1 Tax=Streptomyces sp. MB09-01 TaxID=3028666 RepID=UPI0029AED20B|nr:MFS transporter [Streptomyces sp. MB09-01]MDX3535545.1 MFS transporter [Streptomyces sp. MB09-01]
MAESGPGTPSLWRNRDFRLLLGGQVISFVGDQAQFFALPLIVLAVSGSATQAGLVTGLGTASFLLFGLIAGALADRWNRKVTMIWCEAGRAVLVGSVVVALATDSLTLPHLYGVAALNGMLSTLFLSANSAALPNVVGREQLSGALGYSETVHNTIRVFGAVAAGALYSLSRVLPFAVNAVSFAVSALSLRLIRGDFQEERRTGPRPRLTAEIREGLSWVWHQPVIRFLTLVSAADSVRYGAGYLVIVVLAQEAGASAVEIGVIFSGAAIGALLGALVSDRVVKRYPLGRIAVTMLWLEALGFPLYAIAPNPTTLGLVAALESLVAPVYMVAISTYRLAITPDELRGRVSSTESTLTMSALAIGSALSGTLITVLGTERVVLLLSLWMLCLAVLTSTRRAVRTAPIASLAKAAPRPGSGTGDESVVRTGG